MALEVQKYFMKKMFQIEHTETVRPSLKVKKWWVSEIIPKKKPKFRNFIKLFWPVDRTFNLVLSRQFSAAQTQPEPYFDQNKSESLLREKIHSCG